jgi:hypothetical protein
MRRNVFPKDQLNRIAEAAGICGQVEPIAQVYNFEVARGRRTYGRRLAELASDVSPDREDVVAAIANRWRAFQESGPPVSQELRTVFRTLRPDDTYMCCFGDALPAEWTGTGWGVLGVELATAVSRGTCLVYLFPSAGAIQRLRTHGLFEYLSPETVEGAIAQFQGRVAMAVSGLQQSELAERIIGLPIDAGNFFAPRHQYIFLTGAVHESVSAVGFLRVTESPSGGAPLLMPLARDIVDSLLNVLLSAAEQSGHQSLAAQLGNLSLE